MDYMVEAELKKKRMFRWIFIVIGIIYLYFTCAWFQMFAVKRNSPRTGWFEAFGQGAVNVFLHPFNVFPITTFSMIMLLVTTCIGGFFVAVVYAKKLLKRHDDSDTVNGDAHLMTVKELEVYNIRRVSPLGKPDTDGPNNMIISKMIKLAIDNRGTRLNCNILVIGGSGAGKSRFFAAPNILQYNCNFVITDPSGELLNDYGKALEDHGYAVKVLNLTDVYRSNKYNPFHYIHEEKDAFTLVDTFIKNTNVEGKSGEKFWEDSEKLLITALVLYLWHTVDEEEQTFANVAKMIKMADIDENDATAQSRLDILFDELERDDPENLAVSQYKLFKLGAGKTLKSILISVGVRLRMFELSDMKYLTSKDELEFEKFADTKQALFVIIPTADMTFNFIVSLLYSQLFTSLYQYSETRAEYGWKIKYDAVTNITVVQASSKKASAKAKKMCEKIVKEIHEGVHTEYNKEKKLYYVYTNKKHFLVGWRGTKKLVQEFIDGLSGLSVERCYRCCPTHTRFILDEFANIGQIPEFDQKLATIRKYEISCSIILQSLAQLKQLYEKQWQTITGNCDTTLLLGNKDGETIKWLLETIGKKTTIVANTSYQDNGNGSLSLNRSSVELLTANKLAQMKSNQCLVWIRQESPHFGSKFDLEDHPNYPYAKETAGTFVIPLSEEAVNRVHGPLRFRKEKNKNKLKNLAGDAENPDTRKTADPLDVTIPPAQPNIMNGSNPVELASEEEKQKKKKERDVKNKAKKQAAKKAEDDLRKFYEDRCNTDEDVESAAVMDFLNSVGVNPQSSLQDIKESTESYLAILKNLSKDENIEYKKTE